MGDIIVSYSEVDSYRQCPHKHDLAYRQRWTKDKPDDSATSRGTMWHKILDAHYTALQSGVKPEPAVSEKFTEWYRAGRDSEVLELLEWMYTGYLEQYGYDEDWEILAVEYKAVVPLRTAAGRKSGFSLKFVVDLVVRHRITGKIWLIDHKSHANLPSTKELDFDEQFGMYTWGLRQLGKKPFGSIYSTARTTRNKGDYPNAVELWQAAKDGGLKPGAKPKQQTLDERFNRYLMTRTDTEIDNIALDTLDTVRTMYGRSNRRERHTNSDTCKWRCDYKEACLLGRKTNNERELLFLKETGFRQDFTRH